jgi:hypothetical protein
MQESFRNEALDMWQLEYFGNDKEIYNYINEEDNRWRNHIIIAGIQFSKFCLHLCYYKTYYVLT